MRNEFQGRPCPKCGKKGLYVPMHPHAFGWKNTDGKVACRYCGAKLKRKDR